MHILYSVVSSIVSGTIGAIMGTSVRNLISGDVGDKRTTWMIIMLTLMTVAMIIVVYLYHTEGSKNSKESFTAYVDD